MDELDPSLRALLADARDAEGPDEDAELRIRVGLIGALGGADGAPVLQPPPDAMTTGAARAAEATGGLGLGKWLAGTLLLGAAAGGIWLAGETATAPVPTIRQLAPVSVHGEQAATRAIVTAPTTTPGLAPASDMATAGVRPPAAATPAAVPATTAPASAADAVADASPRAEASPRHPVAEPRAAGGPSELDLIAAATGALRDERPQEALHLLAEHRRHFRSGALSPEREGLRVVALCAAGKTAEGVKARERFLARFAHSPLAGRVQAACDGAP